MPQSADITHISDTALWVATYRADESTRPDALFRDELAGILAGERGRRIADAMPYPKIIAWGMVIRTVSVDALIQRAITLGIDTVINLGAGLDTRPYRMELPAKLRWIEVDFPQILQYKSEKLAAHKPRCVLEHIGADLSTAPARRKLFDQIAGDARRALIVTEGVLPYFTSRDAASLSRDLLSIPSFHYWIQDYYQGGAKVWASPHLRRRLKSSTFRFGEKDWVSFFLRHGWTILENRPTTAEADRIGRPFPFPSVGSVSDIPLSGTVSYKRPSETGDSRAAGSDPCAAE